MENTQQSNIDKRIHRNNWTKHIKIISGNIPDITSEKIKLDSTNFIDLMSDYIILTKLAKQEIELYEKQIDLAIANAGLDLWDMFFNSLIGLASKYIEPIRLSKFLESVNPILKSDQIEDSALSKTYLDPGWENFFQTKNSDNQIESFLL